MSWKEGRLSEQLSLFPSKEVHDVTEGIQRKGRSLVPPVKTLGLGFLRFHI